MNDVEIHPWEPFMPADAKVLIMGTFPPAAKRWSMDFYYPNPINDFWRIMGMIFLGDKDALWNAESRSFRLPQIKELLAQKGIAMNDTARKARRTMGNASDKFLEIVEPVPLYDLLKAMPQCRSVATTGEKAAQVVASITDTQMPKMGECVVAPDGLNIWRMPSTSRAYPMKLEKKAEYYRKMFEAIFGSEL